MTVNDKYFRSMYLYEMPFSRLETDIVNDLAGGMIFS